MKHFHICEVHGKTPCVFTEQTMRKLWERSSGDIPRCIRHGCLISNGTWQPDIESARKWARKDYTHA